ncbi:MAG TPA: hypothetical protein VF618_24485 [Thermoanaerobaculia bacterium]
MENVAEVRELEDQVRRRMADATFTIDPPASATGSWWIDVQRYGRVASIEWRPGKGFGIAAQGGGYGEGVDFVVDDASTAAEHVTRVLQPQSRTLGGNVVISDSRQQQLVDVLTAHIDSVVGDVVRESIETLLRELRNAGDESWEIDRIADELPRIAERVLTERASGAVVPTELRTR